MVAEATTAASGIIRSSWMVVLLPVVSALLTLFFGKRTPGKGAVYGIVTMGAAFLMSLLILWHFVQGGGTYASQVNWFSVGPFHVEAGQYIDGLAAVMLVVVTSVSLCVQVYSLGYMDGDSRFTWFYVVLSLFTAAMLNVVIAPNLIQLLVGWEIMGVCSYLLIGHWYEVKENSNAAIKAFITTRIGDVPFMFGIFALIFATGFTTSNIAQIGDLVKSHELSSGLVAAAALLIFGGTIGKSAQFPLHVWLPDAMAGPTPVSALIHAATMVAAGVYLVGRMYEVFINADAWVLQVVGVIGAITMLGSAFMALVQDDIKRVLAYSTLSQLAYMVAAMSLGPAGRNASFFHLFTHAFFKALLFLGAGSVIHAVHSNNMSDMGGLRKPMPITFWTFLIGSAALAGIVPLAGFWSKDELLVSASHGHEVLFVIMLATAVLTAFYTTRMVALTFFGTYEGHGHPHESPPSMAGPLVFLAAATVVVGFLGSPQLHAPFFKWVFFEEPEAVKFVPWIALVGTVAALVRHPVRLDAVRAAEGTRPAPGARSRVEPAGAPFLHRRLLHDVDRLSRARQAVRGRVLVQPAHPRRHRERRGRGHARPGAGREPLRPRRDRPRRERRRRHGRRHRWPLEVHPIRQRPAVHGVPVRGRPGAGDRLREAGLTRRVRVR